jgi:glycosyltransferase involved in cell wall biosynthesis
MRILFVAMAGAIHTARWINQLRQTGWDIHLFDSMDRSPHPDLNWVVSHTDWIRSRWPFPRGKNFIRAYIPALSKYLQPSAETTLHNLIRHLRPDCIHSLEMQNESYPLADVYQKLNAELKCPWIYSSWGQDIYLYQHDPEHQHRIQSVLTQCQYYIPDCARDIKLAQERGFKGEVLGVLPTGGGYVTGAAQQFRQPGAPSQRKVIAVKGYEHLFGRALTALKAIERCADVLEGYTIAIYSAHDSVKERASNLAAEKGLRIEIVSKRGAEEPQAEFLKLLGRSRLAIGVHKSDGTPNTMLEAMLMGAFPIQTDAGGATAEWITDGTNGLIVPYDDPDAIAIAIRRALSDDTLVDDAASVNVRLIAERLEYEQVQARVLRFYEHVITSREIGTAARRIIDR